MYSCSYATLICSLRKVKTLIKEVPFYGEMIIMNTRLFITYWTVTCVRCLLVLDWTRWTQNNFLVYPFICSSVCFLVYLFFLHILKKIYVLSYPHLLFLPFSRLLLCLLFRFLLIVPYFILSLLIFFIRLWFFSFHLYYLSLFPRSFHRSVFSFHSVFYHLHFFFRLYKQVSEVGIKNCGIVWLCVYICECVCFFVRARVCMCVCEFCPCIVYVYTSEHVFVT